MQWPRSCFKAYNQKQIKPISTNICYGKANMEKLIAYKGIACTDYASLRKHCGISVAGLTLCYANSGTM